MTIFAFAINDRKSSFGDRNYIKFISINGLIGYTIMFDKFTHKHEPFFWSFVVAVQTKSGFGGKAPTR